MQFLFNFYDNQRPLLLAKLRSSAAVGKMSAEFVSMLNCGRLLKI